MRAAVIVFPGTWSDSDTVWALAQVGVKADRVWHRTVNISDYDLIVLPGGFSYGDYLRCGSIAQIFSDYAVGERTCHTRWFGGRDM